jgi:NTP pyrophosphatase (non-canonical NTP hydrolase)
MENFTLKKLQEYVRNLEKERGFDQETVVQKCLMLGEEAGEFFKAIRKDQKVTRVDGNSEQFEAAGEMADILIVLATIANRLDIDLEQAFFDKEEENKQRKWS